MIIHSPFNCVEQVQLATGASGISLRGLTRAGGFDRRLRQGNIVEILDDCPQILRPNEATEHMISTHLLYKLAIDNSQSFFFFNLHEPVLQFQMKN